MTYNFKVGKLNARNQTPSQSISLPCHSDQTRVRDLYNRLTKDGVDVWLDKEKLLPGQDWKLEIQKAVRESDVLIVFL